jgi:hypothetical protein
MFIPAHSSPPEHSHSFVSSLFLFPIRDVYPGSRIPDPTATKKRRENTKLVVLPFIVAINFTNV